MLDRKFILENIALIKTNCAHRGVAVDVDQLVSLEEQRRQKQAETEELNRLANEASKAIGKATSDEEKEACKAEGRELRRQKDALLGEVQQLEENIYQIQSTIPNLSHPEAPVGDDDGANLELQKGATPIRTLDFQPLDHVQLGEQLDLFDFDAGGKVAGHGFYYLKNDAVLLELALQHFALNFLIKKNLL